MLVIKVIHSIRFKIQIVCPKRIAYRWHVPHSECTLRQFHKSFAVRPELLLEPASCHCLHQQDHHHHHRHCLDNKIGKHLTRCWFVSKKQTEFYTSSNKTFQWVSLLESTLWVWTTEPSVLSILGKRSNKKNWWNGQADRLGWPPPSHESVRKM